jgi:Tol biopolymer transport system component
MIRRVTASTVLAFAVVSASALGQAISRVSVSSSGAQGNGYSTAPSASADGRFVAFHSGATNLVDRDRNGFADVFVRDRLAASTERVSLAASGSEADGDSTFASISADGRFVAFRSTASNLVDGDRNGVADVFVRDRATGSTRRASVDSAGAEADRASDFPAISANGRFVAFSSAATNLVDGDVDGFPDVFVHDLQSGETSIVTVGQGGAAPDRFGVADALAISADGRFVAFQHLAGNLVADDTNEVEDVFVRDRVAGTTLRASVASSGEQADARSGLGRLSISADGRFVTFASDATNLVPGDTNGVSDTFVHDADTWDTTLVSATPTGEPANGPSSAPSISSDGRFVAFLSVASNFAPGDGNALGDVFVRDLFTTTVTCASLGPSGAAADGESYTPAIAADGREVAFISYATNLVPGDTNRAIDVFARDLAPCRGGTMGSSTLAVNGATAFAPVDLGSSIAVSLGTSASGPSPARYVLWLWRGSPASASSLAGSTGCTVGPTPLDPAATPQPFACVRGGAPASASRGTRDLAGPPRAPWTRDLAITTRPGTFTLQGAVEDSSAPAGFGITNAVLVSIQ